MRKVGLAVLTAALLTGATTQTVANDDRLPPSATEVSGAILAEEHMSTEIRTFGNDRLWRVGARFETTYEWSDARMPTSGWSVRNITHYAGWPEDGPTVWLASDWDGTIGLDGSDGTWTGTIKGVLYPDGSSDSQVVLTGDGAYEGLTAVLYLRGTMSSLEEPGVDEEPFSGGELRGFILSGPDLEDPPLLFALTVGHLPHVGDQDLDSLFAAEDVPSELEPGVEAGDVGRIRALHRDQELIAE